MNKEVFIEVRVKVSLDFYRAKNLFATPFSLTYFNPAQNAVGFCVGFTFQSWKPRPSLCHLCCNQRATQMIATNDRATMIEPRKQFMALHKLSST